MGDWGRVYVGSAKFTFFLDIFMCTCRPKIYDSSYKPTEVTTRIIWIWKIWCEYFIYFVHIYCESEVVYLTMKPKPNLRSASTKEDSEQAGSVSEQPEAGGASQELLTVDSLRSTVFEVFDSLLESKLQGKLDANKQEILAHFDEKFEQLEGRVVTLEIDRDKHNDKLADYAKQITELRSDINNSRTELNETKSDANNNEQHGRRWAVRGPSPCARSKS